MSEVVFPKGMILKWFGPKERPQNVPDWIFCKLSVRTAEFAEFMKQNDNNGWLNIDVKQKKSGDGFYLAVDTWKPKGGDAPQTQGTMTEDQKWEYTAAANNSAPQGGGPNPDYDPDAATPQDDIPF